MFAFLGLIIGIIWGGNFSGAFLGFIIGSFIDGYRLRQRLYRQQHHYKKDKFSEILLTLAAYVIKSDGKTKESELKYVSVHLSQNYPLEYAQYIYQKLREYVNHDIDIQTVCEDLRENATVHEKLYIIQFLFGLASSDGIFDQLELNVIQQISDNIGVARSDFESIKAMYVMFNQNGGYTYYGRAGSGSQSYSGSYSSEGYSQGYENRGYNLDTEYNILELSSTATNDEVKRAYRKLAQKYHPDKVNHLGEEIKKDAEKKFIRLNQAYERIKKSRGIN